MEEFNSYEYGAEQKSEGKFLAAKLLLIAFYIIYTLSYFIIIFVTRIFTLGALIPVTLWIIVYFTWRYTTPDYKYVIRGGNFSLYINYGKKSKSNKKKTGFKISSAVAIAPMDSLKEDIKRFSPRKIYSAIPYKAAADKYAAIYQDGEEVRCVLYFVATAEALKLLHLHNSSTVITNTEK